MKILAVVLSSITLVACGGGGSGGGTAAPSGPVTSTLSFPVRSGLNALTASGQTVNLTANGTAATQLTDGLCTGTLHGSKAPATGGATFEAAPALSAVSVSTLTFSNCTPATATSTATNYYDSNYLPMGDSIQGGNYGVFLIPPTVPNAVTVGTPGTIGTETLYTSSTKLVGAGRKDISFVVEPDTATTAIFNLVTKQYNASSQLLYTEQARYRMTSTGALTATTLDIQYATTSTNHLVFR